MKPDHRLSLALVILTTLNAVCFSATGELLAAIYAFACAGLVVFVAKDDETVLKALQLAREANDGWAASVKHNGELIERLGALLRRPSLDHSASDQADRAMRDLERAAHDHL